MVLSAKLLQQIHIHDEVAEKWQPISGWILIPQSIELPKPRVSDTNQSATVSHTSDKRIYT